MKLLVGRLLLIFSFLASCPTAAGQSKESTSTVSRVAEQSSIPTKASGIWDDITNGAKCQGCQGVVVLLKDLAHLGDRVFVSILQDLCKQATSEDDDVCDGVIALEGPVLASSLRKMKVGSRASKNLCAGLIGLCPFPPTDPYKVPLPAIPTAVPRPKPFNDILDILDSKELIKIAHFSDIHVDALYTVGANTNCTKPMCCRSYEKSDEPGNNDFPAGPFGDHNCGPPESLEKSIYKAIQQHEPQFSIFTGDIVDHALWNTTIEHNTMEIKNAYQNMADAGMKLVYGTIGNHEQHPSNAIAPNDVNNSAQWLYNLIASAWTRWIGYQPEVKVFGAYSVKYPKGNLRIISLSTNMYYTLNFWLYQETRKDPDDQLAWLVQELDKAEQAGERVFILGHMPMGNSDSFYDGSNYFDQVVNRYKDTIGSMFFGHTHLDHFQLSYSNYTNRQHSNAVAMSYIAPSVTPVSGMPAFRIYTLNPKTFGVVDVETYYADMSNPQFQKSPTWTKYYSAREAYGPLVQPPLNSSAELTPAFWHNVTVSLESNQTSFGEYWARRTRGWDVQPCDEKCRKLDICQLRAARSENNCFVPSLGSGLSIRSVDAIKVDKTKCDNSMMSMTLRLIASRKDLLGKLAKQAGRI
ncbi:hypothetical protein NM208_g4994 [Fusarium decemcellulare]|uniref:Uncharacterized protein n=1 Tax=Fusarium decemcellulare TaxID=57161 RepID=A0ACC1SIN5_9HYPO|nr:hypothetical protein NM208_g4994 [Fusarium decemcellulare]